jgi:hypothetical protein
MAKFTPVADTVHGNAPYVNMGGTSSPMPTAAKSNGKKWTSAKDDAADKKAGIKPGSKRDNALDKKRGVKT